MSPISTRPTEEFTTKLTKITEKNFLRADMYLAQLIVDLLFMSFAPRMLFATSLIIANGTLERLRQQKIMYGHDDSGSDAGGCGRLRQDLLRRI